MTRLSTLITLILSVILLSIPPQKAEAQDAVKKAFNYQAAARDALGATLSEKPINLRITILKGGADGETVYSEVHQTTTNLFGLFNIQVGRGIAYSGQFESILWGESSHWLQVEMDTKGSGDYIFTATSEILSVPYAIHAQSAERLVGGMPEAGTKWHDGSGQPFAETGIDGDYYMDIASGEIYKKSNGLWNYLGKLMTDETDVDGVRADPNDWTNTGNSGTSSSTNFIGTTDAVDFVVKANNTESARFNSDGSFQLTDDSRSFIFRNAGSFASVGIGTSSPLSQMHFKGNSKGVTLRLENTGAGGHTWGHDFKQRR